MTASAVKRICVLPHKLSRVMRKLALFLATNKHADQPAHPLIQISVFVIRCTDSIICLVSVSEISRPVWVQAGRKPGKHVFSRRGSYANCEGSGEVAHPHSLAHRSRAILFICIDALRPRQHYFSHKQSGDLGLNSHPKYWRSQGSNSRPLVLF